MEPSVEWLEQQAALGNRPLYFGDVGDFMTERLEEQSFDRCDAAPQFFVNYELDVFIYRDLR